jgi:hypothetical protein
VATISWQGQAAGTTEIDLHNVRLTQAGYRTELSDLTDGTINVGDGPVDPGAQPGDDIEGIIALKGFGPTNGVEIFVSTTACPSSHFSSPTGNLETTTSSLGRFQVNGDPAYQCLHVYKEGYLIGQSDRPWGNLGALELEPGDLNGDNRVDIADLAIIAEAYDQAHDVADFNHSGKVDIFDLSLLAGNYNDEGPTSFWTP